jgi:hypothetical protein
MTDKLTTGQKMVGLDFNPSGDEKVLRIKQAIAAVIDLIELAPPTSWLHRQLIVSAINALITAQMWAVKVVTWRE